MLAQALGSRSATVCLLAAIALACAREPGGADGGGGSESETGSSTETTGNGDGDGTPGDGDGDGTPGDGDGAPGDGDGEPQACADQCGTAWCGACPDTPMIQLADYSIDATETTIAAYAVFEALDYDVSQLSDSCTWKLTDAWLTPDVWDAQLLADPNNPVTDVDWCDAEAYCHWAGKRLCTTNGEWKAACSANGLYAFPYGDLYNPQACNGVDAGFATVVPVASLPGCEGGLVGLFDMSGNVWEWTANCDDVPAELVMQECRRTGGSWVSTGDVMTCAVISSRQRAARFNNTGFRCCAD